jgi:hypothetical protein
MFLTEVVEKITTHAVGLVVFLIIIEEYCTAGQTTDDTQYTTAHALFKQDSKSKNTDTN